LNYSHEDLSQILGSVGEDVRMDRSVVLVSPEHIHIASHVRIDCFCVLSAGEKEIHIGNFVHLGVAVYLFGASGRIEIEPFCGLSSKVTVYTATDDYTEGFLTNPTVPLEYRKLREGDVIFRKHALVGASSVILPGVTLGVAASVGALTLVNTAVPDFAVVLGNPPRLIGERPRSILDLERKLLNQARP
jgi:dTDP-4-amino-4,6-dideoxy-D-glucose acyltransferase